MSARYIDTEVGTRLPDHAFRLLRVSGIRYCGAATDFTAIHWNERVAKSVGLPGVIAHGALTLANSLRMVTDWAGDPTAVVEYRTLFTRPVVVPDDDDGVLVEVTGVVTEKLDANRVVVALTVQVADKTVLTGTRALVQLS
jgi:acyl dehydratase